MLRSTPISPNKPPTNNEIISSLCGPMRLFARVLGIIKRKTYLYK
jgi:hypothetical protein